MKSLTIFGLLVLLATPSLATESLSALPIYGIDPGAGPADPRPNSDAAAVSFAGVAGALGTVMTIDFEDQPLGSFVTLPVFPGVVAELSGTTSEGGVLLDNSVTPERLGYNTTSAGLKHVGVWPTFDIGTCFLRFSFSTPVQAFGTYVTGLGTANGDLVVQYMHGGSQSIPVSGDSSGGVLYFGFVEPGAAIASVTLRLNGVIDTRDIFAVDDVSFVHGGSVSVDAASWASVKSLYR